MAWHVIHHAPLTHGQRTRTRTDIKPAPVLTGMGTYVFEYGFSRVARVWKPTRVSAIGSHIPVERRWHLADKNRAQHEA
jgi:hypothetical protein